MFFFFFSETIAGLSHVSVKIIFNKMEQQVSPQARYASRLTKQQGKSLTATVISHLDLGEILNFLSFRHIFFYSYINRNSRSSSRDRAALQYPAISEGENEVFQCMCM